MEMLTVKLMQLFLNANYYLNIVFVIGVLRHKICFIIVSTFYLKEAVSGMAYSTGQDLLMQHGVDNCAFTITRSVKKKKNYFETVMKIT